MVEEDVLVYVIRHAALVNDEVAEAGGREEDDVG